LPETRRLTANEILDAAIKNARAELRNIYGAVLIVSLLNHGQVKEI